MSGFEKGVFFRKQVNGGEERESPKVSRREFLKTVGAGTLLAATVGITGPTIHDAIEESVSKEKLLASIENNKRLIKETFNIDVVFDSSVDLGTKKSDELRLAQQERGIALLAVELSKLPPVFIKDSPLTTIALRTGVYEKNGSLQDRFQSENGGVTFGRTTSPVRKILLNVGGNIANGYHLFGWTNGEVHESFRHELFHATEKINDAEWSEIQKGKYRYASKDKQELFLQGSDTRIDGFARGYGALSPAEDKATIYESFGTPESYKEILERCVNDSVLKKKVDKVKAHLLNLSYGLMDESYWLDALNGKAGPEYFRLKAQKLLTESPESYTQEHQDITENAFRD